MFGLVILCRRCKEGAVRDVPPYVYIVMFAVEFGRTQMTTLVINTAFLPNIDYARRDATSGSITVNSQSRQAAVNPAFTGLLAV